MTVIKRVPLVISKRADVSGVVTSVTAPPVIDHGIETIFLLLKQHHAGFTTKDEITDVKKTYIWLYSLIVFMCWSSLI